MSIDKSNSSCATDGINSSCSASYPAEEKDDWIVEELKLVAEELKLVKQQNIEIKEQNIEILPRLQK